MGIGKAPGEEKAGSESRTKNTPKKESKKGTKKDSSKELRSEPRNNPNRGRSIYLVNVVALCIITLLCLGVSVRFVLNAWEATAEKEQLQEQLDTIIGEDKSLYTQDEVDELVLSAKTEGAEEEKSQLLMQIQSDMQSGGSTVSMLRKLFAEDLVVVSGGKYYFYPVDDSLAMNNYSSDDFTLSEDGRLLYAGSDSLRLMTGVDISYADGEIDWESVAEDDISFAMISAGSRLTIDSEENVAGDLLDDELMGDNIDNASNAGLSVGAYWTLGATSEEEATEEAEHLIEILADYKGRITYPVGICINVPSETDRTVNQGRADFTSYVLSFCEILEENGYQPLIYGNLASFVISLEMADLEEYSKWISNSGASLYFPYDFYMWQYSTSGTVTGISTEVHLNAIVTQDQPQE